MSKGNKMDQAALRYHSEGRPGKIAVVPTKPYHTQHDLSLAYSPGVAAPCRAIEANPDDVYRYTNKGNLIAVISNGTAVLGLGVTVGGQWLIVDSPDVDDGAELNLAGIFRVQLGGGIRFYF